MEKNSQEAVIIFPHQLFQDHPAITPERPIFLVEDQLFFKDYQYNLRFHKKKLILHRASMKAYHHYLESEGCEVYYIDYSPSPHMDYIFNLNRSKTIYLTHPTDYTLEQRLKREARSRGIEIVFMENPSFITSLSEIENYFSLKKHYSMTSFYIRQRKKLNILVENGKPIGGKWSYDTQNRKKIPHDMNIPPLVKLEKNQYVKEAEDYVSENFNSHLGEIVNFFYPTTHQEAVIWLDDFIKNRLRYFGDYEDAMKMDEAFLFHSVLSSSLNIGLLTPAQIIERIEQTKNIPLNSKEGFIRQIIGWREFLRGIYVQRGIEQRTCNKLGKNRKITRKLYYGRTGILPYDKVVERVKDLAYTHHIERLMVLGNLMLLCDLHPDEVYSWFMEMFIDAYDWVMVPNIYGMSQYADGGLITTKPYISSSNYLRRMGDFEPGEWTQIWDALFWRFMKKHEELIRKNPRLSLLKKGLENKEKIEEHLRIAEGFLEKL